VEELRDLESIYAIKPERICTYDSEEEAMAHVEKFDAGAHVLLKGKDADSFVLIVSLPLLPNDWNPRNMTYQQKNFIVKVSETGNSASLRLHVKESERKPWKLVAKMGGTSHASVAEAIQYLFPSIPKESLLNVCNVVAPQRPTEQMIDIEEPDETEVCMNTEDEAIDHLMKFGKGAVVVRESTIFANYYRVYVNIEDPWSPSSAPYAILTLEKTGKTGTRNKWTLRFVYDPVQGIHDVAETTNPYSSITEAIRDQYNVSQLANVCSVCTDGWNFLDTSLVRRMEKFDAGAYQIGRTDGSFFAFVSLPPSEQKKHRENKYNMLTGPYTSGKVGQLYMQQSELKWVLHDLKTGTGKALKTSPEHASVEDAIHFAFPSIPKESLKNVCNIDAPETSAEEEEPSATLEQKTDIAPEQSSGAEIGNPLDNIRDNKAADKRLKALARGILADATAGNANSETFYKNFLLEQPELFQYLKSEVVEYTGKDSAAKKIQDFNNTLRVFGFQPISVNKTASSVPFPMSPQPAERRQK